MPDTTLPLNDLTRQIAQRQAELERLRQEHEARQARLADLSRQREALKAQLRQVEADIQAVTKGQAAGAAAPTEGTRAAARPKLADALVEVLREVNRAMTARQLGEELTRRNFPTTSGDITNLVQNRLSDLVKKGVLRRAKGRRGVRLPRAAAPSPKAAAAKKAAPARAAARKTKAASPPPKAGFRKGQPSLRSLLTELLQKSKKPVPARDLAEQVLATGYKTKSKNFTDVVWTALGQLKNVENVKGLGWRLKKG
jgi:hypothetical protein